MNLRYFSPSINTIFICLRSLHANVARYESDLISLRIGLHQLRRRFKCTPNFEFSPAGLVYISPRLFEESNPPRFFVLKRPAPRLHSRFQKLLLLSFSPSYIYLYRFLVPYNQNNLEAFYSVELGCWALHDHSRSGFRPFRYYITRNITIVGGGASGTHATITQ